MVEEDGGGRGRLLRRRDLGRLVHAAVVVTVVTPAPGAAAGLACLARLALLAAVDLLFSGLGAAEDGLLLHRVRQLVDGILHRPRKELQPRARRRFLCKAKAWGRY